MEAFGIALSIPVAFLASLIYCFILAKIVIRFELLSRWLRIASIAVVTLLGIELVLLISQGAARSQELLGPSFYIAHLVIFLSGTPAVANLLVLRKSSGRFGRWYSAAIVCALVAFLLVLLQYGVSEALFGVNGDDGPVA